MTAPIENLLPRLDKVRQLRPNSWQACCPAHADKNPSLSIREKEDGTLLIRCFAECSAHEIVSAVGLDLNDLFPDRPQVQLKPTRRPFSADDALRCLAGEVSLVLIALYDYKEGRPASDQCYERVLTAIARITEAERLCHGN